MTIAARLYHPRASIRLAAKREARVNEALREFVKAQRKRPWWTEPGEKAA